MTQYELKIKATTKKIKAYSCVKMRKTGGSAV